MSKQIIDLNSTVILRELIRKNDSIVAELLSALVEILESRKIILWFLYYNFSYFGMQKRHSKISG